MQGPVEINFKNVRKTKAVENLIYQKVAKLEQVCRHMTSCRVTVDMVNRYQQKGSPFRVNIDVTVPPRHELVVKHKSTDGNQHDPLPNVLREAFNTADRRLKALVQRQHGEIKTHTKKSEY